MTGDGLDLPGRWTDRESRRHERSGRGIEWSERGASGDGLAVPSMQLLM